MKDLKKENVRLKRLLADTEFAKVIPGNEKHSDDDGPVIGDSSLKTNRP